MPRKPKPPGSTTAGGWGHQHQQLRASYAARMAAGEVFTCWRCRHTIRPGTPWDLGHSDDHTRTIGPEHRHCNRSAAARKKNRKGRRDSALPASGVMGRPATAARW